jgi:type I restriction enzyme S subunit
MAAIIDYRGVTPTKSAFGVPLITAKIVKNGRVLEPTEYIPVEDYDAWMRRGLPEPGDVVMTTEAPLGEIAQLDGRKVALAQRLITLRGNPNILDNSYLKFLMQSEFVQDQLIARATGTTVMGIKQSELRKVSLVLPPLPEQRAIAHILGTLDEKIELNRRKNETLEAMARALFKSWFVDFDPVRAKAAGRQPYGMDAETAALFPDSFEDSPLGEVPRRWRVSTIGEEVTVVGGSTPSTHEPAYWENGDIHWATPKDLASLDSPVLLDTDRRITELGLRQISSGLLPKGTVLLSSRAPIGYLAISEVPVAVNQGFIAMLCDRELPNHYILQWVRSNMDIIEGRANGTTFLEISKTNFRPIQVLVPSNSVLRKFTEQTGVIHQRAVSNLRESHTLASLRDALLPKLLSGEVRVKDAEKFVGHAV